MFSASQRGAPPTSIEAESAPFYVGSAQPLVSSDKTSYATGDPTVVTFANLEGADTEEEIKKRLRGLGYIS